MKKCLECRLKYSDEFQFCTKCGSKLKSNIFRIIKNNLFYDKKSVIIILSIFIIFSLGIGSIIFEGIKTANEKAEIENYKNQKWLEDYLSTPTTYDLRINSEWTYNVNGNYIYIKGSVTNTSSSKTISYFEIEAKFYDRSGNVIDSDWTNDSSDLKPGETRQFDMMHEKNNSIDDIKLFIREVM